MTQSGIRLGQRNQIRANDTDELIHLAKFLYDNYNLEFKREWYIGFDKTDGYLCRVDRQVNERNARRFQWKNPDLICCHPNKGFIVIELDGAVHDFKFERTRRRNELYINSGVKLIVLNKQNIKEIGKTVEGELERELMKYGILKDVSDKSEKEKS